MGVTFTSNGWPIIGSGYLPPPQCFVELLDDVSSQAGHGFPLEFPEPLDRFCPEGIPSALASHGEHANGMFGRYAELLASSPLGAAHEEEVSPDFPKQLLHDLQTAFERKDVVRLSRFDLVRHEQSELMKLIVLSAASDPRMARLLEYMRADLGDHFFHGLRVAVMHLSLLTYFLGSSNIPEATLNTAGISHDCGKLLVDQNILFKHDSLTPEEIRVMKMHNEAAFYILRPLQDAFPHLAEIVIFHHPYPRSGEDRRNGERRWIDYMVMWERRLAGDRRIFARREFKPGIERAGLLLRMADTYDALASEREYKEAFPAEKVRAIMSKYFPGEEAILDFLMQYFPAPVS